MFYKASSPDTGNMWDTWLYLHEGTYYLYSLCTTGKPWNNISMASSQDGVHWAEIGRVIKMNPQAVGMGTGSTWKSPDFENDGKFIMNFSQAFPDQPQSIYFAESTDLIHWTQLDEAKCEFKQNPRWYKPDGRWDCIWTVPRQGGGYYGYWTATPKSKTGGQFGFGQSMNGVTWEALPPPETHGFGEGEVGAVEKIGEKYYMMIGADWSMYTLVADRPQGPFGPAKKNFNLLAGAPTYFSRFFSTPEGLLVNHHASSSIRRADGAKEVYFSPLKTAVLDEEGTLRLGWWQGNEKMKHEQLDVKTPGKAAGSARPHVHGSEQIPSITMLGTIFNRNRGLILEGALILPDNSKSPKRGLYIECETDPGSAVRLDSGGIAELGSLNRDGSGFQLAHRIDREMYFGSTAAFRLLLKYRILEFYLDDIFIGCIRLEDDFTGRIGIINDSGNQTIGNLKAWY